MEGSLHLLKQEQESADQTNLLSIPPLEKHSRSANWFRNFAKIFVFLLPSFLTPQQIPGPRDKREILPTTYLDGLRGLFSFLVYVRHFLLPWQTELDTGFAQRGNDNHIGTRNNIMKLPILRLIYAGPTVAIFFITSGFVLANKPLKLIRKGHHEALFDGLASSVFRRAPRLFLPPMATTFIVAMVVQLGLFSAPYDTMPATVPRHPEHFDSLVLQLQDWVRFLSEDLTHLWSWRSPKSEYDSHLWTIPIQFRASMIVYLVLIGLARVRKPIRQTLVLFFCIYALQQHRWEVALFLAGVFIAERNLMIIERQQTFQHLRDISGPLRNWPLLEKILWRILFTFGLFLGSYPRGKNAGPNTPGYIWISNMTHEPRNWQSYGAAMMVFALIHDRYLQSLFTSRLLRFMGDISFSLYLVHGPVLHVFGYSLVSEFHSLTGTETNVQFQLGVLWSFILLSPVVIWIADVFWRLVDKPCSTLVADYENFCFY